MNHISCKNGSINKNGTKLKKYNDIEPFGRSGCYIGSKEIMNNLFNKRIKELFNISTIGELFGINDISI